MRQSLSEHAQALSAAQSWANSSVHPSQVEQLFRENKALSLEKEALQIERAQLCRELERLRAQRQELLAMLEQESTRPSILKIFRPSGSAR